MGRIAPQQSPLASSPDLLDMVGANAPTRGTLSLKEDLRI
jgi:hypothetical protein